MGIQTATTAFTRSKHGFHFPNEFSASAILRELGRLGSVAAAVVDLIGDWEWGLCGGMCWAALDRYFEETPVPERTDPPTEGDSLFKELVHRQLDTFDGVTIIQKFLEWQGRPDTGSWDRPHSVGHLTQTEEWPLVKSNLDSGIPATLGLVRVSGVSNPSDNHQVVATGYTYDTDTKQLEIDAYDPNHRSTTVIIGMTFGQESSRLDAWQSTGERVRGFFFIPYDRQERIIAPEVEMIEVPEDLSWFWPLFSGP